MLSEEHWNKREQNSALALLRHACKVIIHVTLSTGHRNGHSRTQHDMIMVLQYDQVRTLIWIHLWSSRRRTSISAKEHQNYRAARATQNTTPMYRSLNSTYLVETTGQRKKVGVLLSEAMILALGLEVPFICHYLLVSHMSAILTPVKHPPGRHLVCNTIMLTDSSTFLTSVNFTGLSLEKCVAETRVRHTCKPQHEGMQRHAYQPKSPHCGPAAPIIVSRLVSLVAPNVRLRNNIGYKVPDCHMLSSAGVVEL